MAQLIPLRRMGHPDLTAHGLRSTFRDRFAEFTNYLWEVAEAALAHVVRDKTEAAYFGSDVMQKCQQLMDRWGKTAPDPNRTETLSQSAPARSDTVRHNADLPLALPSPTHADAMGGTASAARLAVFVFVSILSFFPPAARSQSTLPVWFGPNDWYPETVVKGATAAGKGPGWRPGFSAQGDFNALFAPGAPWDPSKIALLVINSVDILLDPQLETIAAWANAHPRVKIGLVNGMLTVGPRSGCVASGDVGFAMRGTSLTASTEGVEFHENYDKPGWDFSVMSMNAIKRWKEHGGRLDMILMDTPLAAGIGKCSFTVAQTVSNMLPFVHQVLRIYPNVQFSLEQGPDGWTDEQWIDYTLHFFSEFRRQVGVPVSYINLDLHLGGDVRKPPTPLFSANGVTGTVNKAVSRFQAAGVGVAVNINVEARHGETQEDLIRHINACWKQVVESGLPFDHVSLQPFSVFHDLNRVMNNLPNTSPAALTWLLEQHR
jgi:hypothetical protein